MPTETDVNKGSSTSDVKTDSSTKQTAEQLQAEIDRKKEELKSLTDQVGNAETLATELEDVKAEIAALKEEGGNKRRLETLESAEDDLEFQIAGLRKDPKNRAFFNEFDKKLSQAEERGGLRALIAIQQDMVEDWASENKLDYKKFRVELLKFADQQDDNPIRKAKNAYKGWKEFQEFRKDKDALAVEKAKLNGSSENGTRKTRETTLEEAIKDKDLQAQKRLLGL